MMTRNNTSFSLLKWTKSTLAVCILASSALLSPQAYAAITYFNSASTPADGDSSGTSPTDVTPPSGMVTGDLVILVGNSRDNGGTLAISNAGGQTWTAQTANTSNVSQRIFWARFNGTWSANPSVSNTKTKAFTVVMHVFRPSASPNTWAIDVAQVNGSFSKPSSPGDIPVTGITTVTNGALVFANIASTDNNTFDLQSTASGWANAGDPQYRNRDNSDSSQASAYKVMPTAGASGNVTFRMTSSADDKGNSSIVAFKEIASRTISIANATVNEGNSGTTSLNFTVTLSASTSSTVTASYSTSNGTATGGSCGTAGVDYASVTGGTVSIAAGSTTATIPISICGDTTNEGNESFTVTLTAATNASISSATATGTISNDDAASSATCNSGAISGIINTYYTGAASVSAGATSITVGTSSGASTAITAGDLILVMQMQDVSIDVTNTSAYGTSSSINAGKYEYAKVTAVAGSTLTLATPLSNSYTKQTGTDAVLQKTFQVIRVPVYSSATLSTGITAKAWDGGSGGVVAFDVTGALTLNSQTISVAGKGFRGGGGRSIGSGSGNNTDYRTPAKTNNANGAKGEGTAGTPYRTYDGSTTITGTVEGYTNGSNARGAPANAGGGGTDGNPTSNDQNTGGGGGANAGAGGQGGIGWCGAFNAGSAPNYGCSNTGGLGGKVTSYSASQLALGGGGGAGTSNNGTGSPGSGVASSGARGGGMIMIRAGSLTGTATLNADGSAGNSTLVNDGSGGGGAAGSVLISAASGLSGVTVSAKGGKGGDNLVPPNNSSNPHGPGGGGGGGYVTTTGALASCSVTGGANGVTYRASSTTAFGAYGATAGSAGSCVSSLNAASIPGLSLGNGPCLAGISHYSVTYPNGNQKSTCETMTVRITSHDTAHGEISPSSATSIAISLNISGVATTGTSWTLKTGGGTFNTSTNVYTFNGTETYAEFNLTRTTSTASPHIDIDVTDGSKTDLDGDTNEDAKAQFSTASVNFYSNNTGTLATIPTLTAGSSSGTYYVKVIGSGGGGCSSALSGTQNVTIGYQCTDPNSCYTSSAPSCGSGSGYLCFTSGSPLTSKPLAANNVGVTSATATVSLVFDSNGYAPFSFNYLDVGKINLFITSAGATTVTGSTNSFLVKPLDFSIIPCKTSVVGDCTTSPANPGTSGGGNTFVKAGETFKATIKATAVGGSVTPSYGSGSSNISEQISISMLKQAPTDSGTVDGNLDGTGTSTGTALYRSDFSNGIATVGDLTWDEVGVMKLEATNIGFLGTSTVTTTGTSSNIGRFYPDHFVMTSTSLVESACSTGFTYMGQPFLVYFDIEARNTSNQKTSNYSNAYATGTISISAEDANSGSSLLSRLSTVSGSWATGTYTGNDATVTFSRPTTITPDATWGSYEDLTLGVSVSDETALTPANLRPYLWSRDMEATSTGCTADTANTADGNCPAKSIGTTKQRFGRLRMSNSFGTGVIKMPVTMQYWGGNTWMLNSDDSCSSVPLSAVNSSNGSVTPSCASTPTNYCDTTIPTDLKFINGKSYIQLTPSITSGTADICIDLGATVGSLCVATPSSQSYLQGKWPPGTAYNNDPKAKATFGIHAPESKKTVHIREQY